jgi:DNA end-binding protein Ku
MSLRSMANNNITVGLINIPTKMYSAVESNDVWFHQHHVHDDGSAHRVNMPALCSGCGEIVSRSDLVRGVERGDTTILVTADELATIEPESAKDFDVQRFVPATEIDPILYGSPYYIEPDQKRGKRAVETYALLREVLVSRQVVGLVTYCMRGKQHLAVLRALGKTLVVQNICFPADVRAPEFSVLDREVKIDPAELKLANQLVDMMSGEFDTAEYIDTYAAAVADLIDAKEAGVPMSVREEAEAAEEVSDLLAALEASVARHPAGKRRGKGRARKSA